MSELVGRFPSACLIDLEVQLEVRGLLPGHVDDQLKPPPGQVQCRDPLEHPLARVASEWRVDHHHEVEVALAGPEPAD